MSQLAKYRTYPFLITVRDRGLPARRLNLLGAELTGYG
jgi:hypothetical protein